MAGQTMMNWKVDWATTNSWEVRARTFCAVATAPTRLAEARGKTTCMAIAAPIGSRATRATTLLKVATVRIRLTVEADGTQFSAGLVRTYSAVDRTGMIFRGEKGTTNWMETRGTTSLLVTAAMTCSEGVPAMTR